MKILKNIIAVSVLNLLFIFSAQAQEKKIITKEIQVEGVCNMCKSRIENAALIKGVKMAEWDKTSGILTVVYQNHKTSDSTICASIAKAGHDNALIKADSTSYGELPGCCSYRDGLEKH
jgi:mercuric ion binding protein